ncbi:hypothetical protein [Leptospira stimsonii]|uniref:Uncharacterized protein n=1 Tax=Leptospira stimsonii TaxID=2202203 RepID=A0A8B3CKY2_9LEPT|nr:hypothetical protein [Leptospira stimsonii]RHX83850.1 hypothetical protein DLM78_20410 [Leptospira stimsonii]
MNLSDSIVSSNSSVVVTGAMNPTIHHPFWYKFHDLISEDSYKKALNPSMLVSPAISQINFGEYHLACEQEKWSLIVDSIEKIKDVTTIASKVFKLLGETPLSAYGLNFQVHLKTKYLNAGNEISKLIADLQKKFLLDDVADNAGVTLITRNERNIQNLAIQQSAFGKDCLYIGLNYHFIIKELIPKDQSQFELEDLISVDLESCKEKSYKIISNILTNF